MSKQNECEECGFIDDSNENYVFAHHSGLYLCSDCAEKIENEMYKGGN